MDKEQFEYYLGIDDSQLADDAATLLIRIFGSTDVTKNATSNDLLNELHELADSIENSTENYMEDVFNIAFYSMSTAFDQAAAAPKTGKKRFTEKQVLALQKKITSGKKTYPRIAEILEEVVEIVHDGMTEDDVREAFEGAAIRVEGLQQSSQDNALKKLNKAMSDVL